VTVAALVQARMGSTRLPGKVLEPIGGVPALVRIAERVGRAPGVQAVVVVTADTSENDPIRRICRDHDIDVVSGSEHDVLDRYRTAAVALGADVVVRVTADCPLVDPGVIGEVIATQQRTGAAYAYAATGAMPAAVGLRRFPDGLDAEVFPADVLETAWVEATDAFEREHVTPFICRRPERFPQARVEPDVDLGGERWTVDYAEDLEFVRAIFEGMAPRLVFGSRDVLAMLEREPGLRGLNAARIV